MKRKKFRLMIIGGFFIFTMTIMAVSAPFLTIPDPNHMTLSEQFAPPSGQNLFGLDQNGSSVLSRVFFGARLSLVVAFSVVFISTFIGLIIGSLSGYCGGWVDLFFMRIIDMLYAFPGFLLAIALVAALGPSINNLILAMCITGWAGYARLVRGEVLHLKTKDYVLSAQAIGANHSRILISHIWPNLIGPLVVHSSFGMAGTIIAESALSFLGLGAPPTVPSWGGLLNAGRTHLIDAPHISIFPGIAIVTLVLGFNLFGDGLRDYLDPKKS